MIAGISRKLARLIGLFLGLLAIWTASQGTFDPSLHRPIVFGLCALVVVLYRPLASRIETGNRLHIAAAWSFDAVIIGAIALGVARFIAAQDNLTNMLVEFSVTDQWIGLIALIATIELTRREFGPGLAAVAGVILVYCLGGENLPGVLQHAGFSLSQVIEGMWYGFQGVFGLPSSVVIELLFIYIIFGFILEATGAGASLIRIAFRLTGHIPGGSAHAATFASALFGSISGSVTANVAGTGTFTIPMMKKNGFRPEFAGAVEAAASTAGQFIPPVMGAVAFMLAQLTGVSYLLVCVAALVPAFAYLGALFLSIYLEARRQGFKGTAPEDLPQLTGEDFRSSLMFAIPVLAVIVVMLMGRSPAQAGFWATITAIVLGLLLNGDLRRNPARLLTALAKGGISGAKIMIAVGAIGVVVAGFNLTGLGLSFSQAIGSLGSENLILSLLLTATACLVLGMGMPTLPAYLIIVLVMGPALGALGLSKLAAHMFVLYFAALSAITPPVALAAFAAAPIAGANPMRIAVVSMRLTLIGFIVPFLFAYNPSLLLIIDFSAGEFALGILQILAVVWGLSSSLAGFGIGGHMALPMRVLHLAGAALAAISVPVVTLGGIALLVVLALIDMRRPSRNEPA